MARLAFNVLPSSAAANDLHFVAKFLLEGFLIPSVDINKFKQLVSLIQHFLLFTLQHTNLDLSTAVPVSLEVVSDKVNILDNKTQPKASRRRTRGSQIDFSFLEDVPLVQSEDTVSGTVNHNDDDPAFTEKVGKGPTVLVRSDNHLLILMECPHLSRIQAHSQKLYALLYTATEEQKVTSTMMREESTEVNGAASPMHGLLVLEGASYEVWQEFLSHMVDGIILQSCLPLLAPHLVVELLLLARDYGAKYLSSAYKAHLKKRLTLRSFPLFLSLYSIPLQRGRPLLSSPINGGAEGVGLLDTELLLDCLHLILNTEDISQLQALEVPLEKGRRIDPIETSILRVVCNIIRSLLSV